MQPEHPFSNKLDTNYAATTADIPEIKKLIQDYQSTVDGLDDELAKLDLRRQELEERKHTSCESIKKLRSIMSCTRRIPADILSTIFSDLLRIEGPEAEPYPAVTVSHVCRLWRHIALDNPLLWTNIIVNIPPYPLPISVAARASTSVREPSEDESEVYENRMVQFQRRTSSISDRLAAFAARSAQCPLLFSLQAHDEHELGMACEALEDVAEFQDVVDSIFDVALDTCHRWETVRISLRVNSCMPIQLPLVVFAQLSGANTRTLDFDLDYYGMSDMSDVWAKLDEKVNVLQSPLRSLTVRMTCGDIRRIEVRWGQLTDLTLALRYDGSNHLFDSILRVLERTRNLRQLSLEFIGKLEEVSSRTPAICLQHLERLTVKGTAPSTQFAASLDFPILTSFSFPHVKWTPRSEGGIIEWIRRYGPQLTHMSFDYTNFSEASLVWILTNIHNVASLKIYCFHATDVDAEFVLPNGVRAEPPKISPQLLEMLTPKQGGPAIKVLHQRSNFSVGPRGTPLPPSPWE